MLTQGEKLEASTVFFIATTSRWVLPLSLQHYNGPVIAKTKYLSYFSKYFF